jgi:hypothetical protein
MEPARCSSPAETDASWSAREGARLAPDGFGDDRTRVAIDARGDAVLTRAGETIAFRYEGLSAGDVCTAALLFNMIAAPRAAG